MLPIEEVPSRQQPEATQQLLAAGVCTRGKSQQRASQFARPAAAEPRSGCAGTFPQRRASVIEPPALRRISLRRHGRIQALAQRPQPEMDLAHGDVDRRLAHFGEPDELRLIVNAGAVEVPHEEAKRALRCRVAGVCVGAPP